MNARLVITDLTRMYQGNVCIAGYDQKHRCIRPTLPVGISEASLYNAQGQPILYPFAMVECELLKPNPQPPHTEDYPFNPASLSFIKHVNDRKGVLEWSLYKSVEAIFEQPIQRDFGFYVMDCRGPRSLGTVQAKIVTKVFYEQDMRGAWDYRIHFTDERDQVYRLKIVDLTWQYYCQSLRGPQCTPTDIASRLTNELKSCEVFLRVGLARGWSQYPDRCYLQVTGVYTFPDYLNGKTFADFTPQGV